MLAVVSTINFDSWSKSLWLSKTNLKNMYTTRLNAAAYQLSSKSEFFKLNSVAKKVHQWIYFLCDEADSHEARMSQLSPLLNAKGQ